MEYKVKYDKPPFVEDLKVKTPHCLPEAYLAELFPHHELEERCYAIYLNTAGNVIAHDMIGLGEVTHSAVNIHKALRGSFLTGSKRVLFIHNHPSDNTKVSRADMKIAQKLRDALDAIDTELLDALIYTRKEIVSFKEQGAL